MANWRLGGGVLAALALAGCGESGAVKAPQSGRPAPVRFAGDPVAIGPLDYSVIINGQQAPGEAEGAARELCAGKRVCTVRGWSDPANMARTMPMLDREVAAITFSYSVNRNSGFERTLWDCDAVKGVDRESCL